MGRPPKKNQEEKFSPIAVPSGKLVFQNVKGMHDILPKDELLWKTIHRAGEEVSELHDFSYIETPILEPAGLFEAGVGAATDIVEKEMFVFKTRGGEKVVLRPETTAAVIRSYLQHHLGYYSMPLKVYHWGPVFRYEKPQSGRYRQFHQWDFDIIGENDPFYDVEIIFTVRHFLELLGIKDVILMLNTVGCKVCRPSYRKRLFDYYRNKKKNLCRTCIVRLDKNVFRLLDCKEKSCIEIKKEAPVGLNHLCQNCNSHLRGVLELVEDGDLNYEPCPYLVRGLDYYSRTVFEIAAQNNREIALAGGGRYDYLGEVLGSRMIPAVGAALGLERLIEYMAKEKIPAVFKKRSGIFFTAIGEQAKKSSIVFINKLRMAGFRVMESVGKKSLKSQLKAADKAGAGLALIVGQKECFDSSVILRDMKTGAQETILNEKVMEVIKKKLKT